MDIKSALLQMLPENSALHKQIKNTDNATLQQIVGADLNFTTPAALNQLSPQAMEILTALIAMKGANPQMTPIEPMQSLLNITPIVGANPDNSGENARNLAIAQAKQPPTLQNLASLVSGQTFSAEILDIKQGSIALKMGDGNTLNARSLVMPDARIGDKAAFVVREANGGQIMLEFLRGGGTGDSKVSASIIREALTAANMQVTPSNAGIVEDLVLRNMPIDQSILQRTAFFRYSMPTAPFEQIQFLLENNFAATDRTVQVFEGIAKGELSLSKEITNLKTLVENVIPQTPEQAQALENAKNQLQTLQPTQDTQNPNNYLQNLRTIAQEIIKTAKEQGNTPMAQTAENIVDIIDFTRNITETKLYFQLPFTVEDKQHLAELHIFKKKGDKAKKINGYNATALLALDMAFLGRIEVMVNKNGNNINLQVRSNKDKTLETVTLNAKDLSDLLDDAGFKLTQLHTKAIDEKFDISTPLATPQPIREIPQEAPTRYSFDARV
ncbi:MAG: flagellar hook-length control protein FliK [Defluviitaleaceae bacterium]|nr:flagellar hook-length control protein FliK [Defluviitaleaceae bacterium]